MHTVASRPLSARLIALAVAVVLATGAMLASASPAHAATPWAVTDSTDDPATTVGSLRWAALNAASGDSIVFAPGVNSIVITSTVELPAGVIVDGGSHVVLSRLGLGSYIQFYVKPTGADQSYTFQNLTMSGAAGGDGMAIYADASNGSAAVAITLDNVTIHDESATAGAALWVADLDGPLLISGSTFTSNKSDSAIYGGGAVFVDDIGSSDVTIKNTKFDSNSAANLGGAVDIDTAAAVEFDGVSVLDNEAKTAGGVIVHHADSASFANSNFTDNLASLDAGGLKVNDIDGNVSITSTTFESNQASDGSGGAVEVQGIDGRFTSTGSRYDSNTAFKVLATGATGGAIDLNTVAGGFALTGGTFVENGSYTGGGAVSSDTVLANSVVSGVTFDSNDSGFAGGLNIDSIPVGVTVSIQDATEFTNNDGESGGGGFLVDDLLGEFDVVNSNIHNNLTETGGLGGGGVLAFVGVTGVVTVTGSTIDDNFADATGGGLYLGIVEAGGSVTIDHSSLAGNTVNGDGAGLSADHILGEVDIVSSTISGNDIVDTTGAEAGVGVYALDVAETGRLSISSSTFTDNALVPSAGFGVSVGVESLEGNLAVLNSTMDESNALNRASGAVYVGTALDDSVVDVAFSTLRAPDTIVFGVAGGLALVRNSVLQDSAATPRGVVIIVAGGAPAQLNFDALDVPFDAATMGDNGGNQFGLTAGQIGLGALAANGGPTATRLPQTGSVLIDKGDPAAAGAPTYDQRGAGFPRVVGHLDIGAVEAPARLAATGGTINFGLLIAGGIVLVLGIGAIVFARLRRDTV
ncbi:MAG: choice-of-anchor Q domain-containing protein [Rhodoglobus sp.]